MIYLGSHVGMSSPSYYEGSVEEALSYGANAFMFYTGAPQNGFRLDTSLLRIEEGRKLIERSGLDEAKIVVHAPYIINFANPTSAEKRESGKELLLRELRRAKDFNVRLLVLHPGSDVGGSREEAKRCLVEGLNEVLSKDGTDVVVCLETMAGKGGELCKDFLEMKEILSKVERQDRIGVCLDTCHVNDAGYAVDESLIGEFDRAIGLHYLKVVHLNDSKNERRSHKDRHENIGFGTIGFENLRSILLDARLEGIPFILETPYYEKKAPYLHEIKSLREGILDGSYRK